MLFDSTRQKAGYNELTDYYMSEKFGLDWQSYDNVRMRTLFEIMHLKNERDKRDADKK